MGFFKNIGRILEDVGKDSRGGWTREAADAARASSKAEADSINAAERLRILKERAANKGPGASPRAAAARAERRSARAEGRTVDWSERAENRMPGTRVPSATATRQPAQPRVRRPGPRKPSGGAVVPYHEPGASIQPINESARREQAKQRARRAGAGTRGRWARAGDSGPRPIGALPSAGKTTRTRPPRAPGRTRRELARGGKNAANWVKSNPGKTLAVGSAAVTAGAVVHSSGRGSDKTGMDQTRGMYGH